MDIAFKCVWRSGDVSPVTAEMPETFAESNTGGQQQAQAQRCKKIKELEMCPPPPPPPPPSPPPPPPLPHPPHPSPQSRPVVSPVASGSQV